MLAERIIALLIVAIGALAGASRAEEPRIEVHANNILHSLSRYLTGACIEDVNHEIYGGLYSQMIYGEDFPAAKSGFVSRAWREVRAGSAVGGFFMETNGAFASGCSQRITLHGGSGGIGVANVGLNQWGLCFRKGKEYEGCIWARAEERTRLHVCLESADGSSVYASKAITVPAGDWRRFDFTLTPTNSDTAGRFAIVLKDRVGRVGPCLSATRRVGPVQRFARSQGRGRGADR